MAGFGLQFLNGLGESSDVDVFSEDLENKSADNYSASVVDSDFETNNTLVAKDWAEHLTEYAQPQLPTQPAPQTAPQLPTQPAPQTAPQSSNSDSINLSFTMRDAVIFGAGAIAAMIIGKLIK